MSLQLPIIASLTAIVLAVAVRRKWIHSAFARAVASVIALLAVIVAMGLAIRLGRG